MEWQRDDFPAGTLVLIACGGRKQTGANRFAARCLYTGSLFTASLTAARALTTERLICVLSARHGFVRLDTFLRPYEQRWGQPGEISAAKLRCQTRWLPDHRCVVSLMPTEYTRRARQVLYDDHRPFIDTMHDIRGIGDMRHRLTEIATSDTTGKGGAP